MGAQYYVISTKFNAQALIIGRKTAQEDQLSKTFQGHNYSPTAKPVTFIGKRNSARSVVIFDPRGKIYCEDDNMEGEKSSRS